MSRLKFPLASAVGLLMIIHSLPAAEIDQFTGRELYQDNLSEFTPVLNEYTNEIIKKAVFNCNTELESSELTDDETKITAAREIYKLTSGDSCIEFDERLPKILSSIFIVRKFTKGPLQSWIESDENEAYWYQPEDNYYSSLYPSLLDMNKSFVIKVADEFIGPDKIDHFFDQGYGYYTESDYGKNDEAAVDYGIKTEYGIYGLLSGGVFSFADLRANWGGYQFYKNLFIGNPSLLSINNEGKVIINHSFDWADYIDPYYDELINPSFYSTLIAKYIRRHINQNYYHYLNTYESLQQQGVLNEDLVDKSYYLNKDVEYEQFNYFDPRIFFNHQPTAIVLSGDGIKKAYQIGALKALMDIDINIDAVYEVPARTVNTALKPNSEYVQTEETWHDSKETDTIDVINYENRSWDDQFSEHIRLYSDSAASNSSAIKSAGTNDYRKVILISLDKVISVRDIFDNLFGYLNYKIDIIRISPASSLNEFSDFTPENKLQLMRIGYLDSLRTLDILDGNNYYIYNDESIRRMYLSLTLKERLESIDLLSGKTFELNIVSGENSYDEIIAPKLLSSFKSELSMLEHYAAKYNIEESEIYSMSELQELIAVNYIKRDMDIFNTNDNLDFLSYLFYKTKYRYHPESVINERFLESFDSFR